MRNRLQSEDRAHRIGQEKPVFVYKLIAAGNMAEAFAHQGIGAEWNAEIRAGEDAILAVARRDKWVCKAGELNAIRELMDVHDAQLEVVTVSQVEKALAHIKEVKRNKRARRIEA